MIWAPLLSLQAHDYYDYRLLLGAGFLLLAVVRTLRWRRR